MADPPRSPDAQPNDFDGDEEHEDATMVASVGDLEALRAEALAGGDGNLARLNSSNTSGDRERTTLPPEQKVVVASELTGRQPAAPASGGKGPLIAAVLLCVAGFGVLLFALFGR